MSLLTIKSHFMGTNRVFVHIDSYLSLRIVLEDRVIVHLLLDRNLLGKSTLVCFYVGWIEAGLFCVGWIEKHHACWHGGHWISQSSELSVSMCKTTVVRKLTKPSFLKVLANLCLVVAMQGANYIWTWEVIWHRIVHVTLLMVAVSERTHLPKGTRTSLLKVTTKRSFIFLP